MTTTSIDVCAVANNLSQEKCHFIPCEINFDGEANVSNYFNTTISHESTDSENLSAVFRGRPLKGVEISLPSGYTGIVLKEPITRTTDDEDRRLVATNSFDKLNYWNLDKTPTPDDLILKGLQWVDISAALHKPIVEGSSEASSQSSLKDQ